MAMTDTADNDGPIGTLNTTPLIDVMLVLLVMFIITIPLQTHAVKMQLPTPVPTEIIPPRSDYNRVGVDPQGQVRWNGTPIDMATLRTYLDTTRAMVPEPELHIDSDRTARYARVDEMLSVIQRSQVGKVGFVGNERFASFDK